LRLRGRLPQPTSFLRELLDVDRDQCPFLGISQTLIRTNVFSSALRRRWSRSTVLFCASPDIGPNQRLGIERKKMLVAVNVWDCVIADVGRGQRLGLWNSRTLSSIKVCL